MAADPERFLEAALETGRLRPEQADDCRRLLAALGEVQLDLTVDEIALRKGFLTAEQVTELKRELARRRVGKYVILERLGEGATGVVWRAKDTKLDREVALKILSRKVDGLTPFRDRFAREARVAVTLNHVNIVRGLDYGEADGYRFFAMELVPGETLAQRIEWEGRLPEAAALEIGLQVVEALRYVEQFKLVHRDIKPENLLLPPNGPIKLGDLGLAKPTLEEWQRIHDGPAAGTPYYMAPEQIRTPDSVDWRSDVYGLGATLFHALTGAPPFRTDEAGSVIHKHLTVPAPSPREHVLELSHGVSAVVLKMLRKEPDERYASLDELAADLAAVQAGRPPVHALSLVAADSGTFEARVRGGGVPIAERRWGRRIAVACLLAVGIVAAGWSQMQHAPVAPERSHTARAPLQSSSPQDPRGTPETTPGQTSDPDPSATATDPVPSDTERLANARIALQQADAYRTAEPPDLQQARKQYEFVLEKFPDTPQALAAQTGLELVAEGLSRLADDELVKRRALADTAIDDGRLRDAWAALHNFPLDLGETAAATRASEEAAAIATRAKLKNDEALKRLPVAMGARDFAFARRQLEIARRSDLTRNDDFYDDHAERIDHEEQDYLAAHAAEKPAFELFAGRVLRMAAGQGVAAAERFHAAAKFQAHAAELELLHRDLQQFAAARAAVDGRLDEHGTEGGAIALPSQIDPAETELVRGWALLSMARGRLLASADVIALLENRRIDVDGLRDRLAQVRAALAAEVQVLVDAARAARDDGRRQTARTRLRDALDLLPQSPVAHLELAELEVASNNLRAARRAYEQAKPLPEACLGLAQLYVVTDELTLAEQELNDALTHVPFSPSQRAEATALREKVRTRRTAQRVAKLEKELRRATGETRERISRQILDQQPDHLDALFLLGQAYAAQHRNEWERIFDGWHLLQRYVALERRRDKRVRRAESLLEELAKRRDEQDAGALEFARTAVAEARTGDPVRAEEYSRTALRRLPFLETGHLALSLSLLARARRSGGSSTELVPVLQAFDRLLRLNHENTQGRIGRAEARLLDGDWTGALKDAELARKADKSLAAPALLAGRAHLRLDDASAALRQFEIAYENSPSAEALIYQAQAHMRLGQYRAARGKLRDDLVDRELPEHLAALATRLLREIEVEDR